MDIHGLLKMVIDRKASDLHLKVKSPPVLRINGHLMPADLPPYEPAELLSLIESMLTDEQRETFRRELPAAWSWSPAPPAAASPRHWPR